MADQKIVVETPTGGTDLAAMLALLQGNKGASPTELMTLCKDNGMQGDWMFILFFFFLFGAGGNGFGGFGGGSTVQNDFNNATLQRIIDGGVASLQRAIDGNLSAINNLAQTLGCDVKAVNTAINAMQRSIDAVACDVKTSSKDVINQIIAGNCDIVNKLDKCCCSIEKEILRSQNESQKQYSDLKNQMAVDKAEIMANSDENRRIVIDKLNADKLAEVTAERDALRLSATLQSQTATQEAQRDAQTAAIVAAIKCACGS